MTPPINNTNLRTELRATTPNTIGSTRREIIAAGEIPANNRLDLMVQDWELEPGMPGLF